MGFFERSARTYGDIVYFRFLKTPICLIFDPAAIEYVLVKNPANFTKSSDYRALDPLLGKGLLTAEGDLWNAQRKLVQPSFRHEQIGSYGEIMLAAVSRMLEGWRDNQIRDLHKEMMSVTLEIVTKSLFGSDLAGAWPGIGEALGVAMESMISQVNMTFVLPERFPLPKGRRLRRAIEHLDGIIDAVIRDRRSRARRTSDDLLEALMETRGKDGDLVTDDVLRDEMKTFFLAGHETTANALSWTFYLLSQNPEVEERLWNELERVLGGRLPSVSDLPRLCYTEMIVKESLRLYPPVWGFGRRAIQGFEVGGYYIPARTNVFLLQWVTHRDPRFYPDPERFDPERWREDPIRRGALPRFAYFPFGGGPRVCVGAGFAMMEATLLLAAIAQRFQLSLLPGHPIEMLPSITLRPRHGMKMLLRERA